MKVDRLVHVFSMIGEDPARIKQLRQVALALAITGRLGNGSAILSPDEMLRAVEQVKKDLHKQGAIPKPKSLKPIEQEELPESFQNAGRFTPLGSLARVEKGLTGIKQAKPGPFPLVTTGAERASCDRFDFTGAAAIVPLVSSTGHGHASLNRLHYQEGQFALGTILAAVFPYDPALLSARFIFEYLSAFKDELLVTRMTGTANVTLSVGRILGVPVPLIDPATQAKVDELMTLLDRLEAVRTEREITRNRLTTASLARLTVPETDPDEFPDHARFALDALPALIVRPDQIKQLRQTILNLAIRGKLTKQDSSDEPAANLLRQIEEKEERLAADGKIRKSKPIQAVESQPFNIPTPWQWVRLGDIGVIGSSSRVHQKDWKSSGIPFYRAREIVKLSQDGYVNNELFISEALFEQLSAKGFHPEPNDLMITGVGTIGVPYAVQPGDRFYFKDASVLIFKNLFSIYVDYLNLVCLSPYWSDRIHKSSMGTTVHTLTVSRANQVPVPLPPVSEQKRIVAKVDELMGLCDRLAESLEDSNNTRAHLLEAALHLALDQSPNEREAA